MISDYNPIKRIYLKHFRSIKWIVVELPNPVFLVGKNGAGKSNFLKALEFIKNSAMLPLSAVFSMYGGIDTVRFRPGSGGRPAHFGIRVDLALPKGQQGWYAFEIRAEQNHHFRVAKEQCIIGKESFSRNKNDIKISTKGAVPKLESDMLCLPLLGGLEAFSPVVNLLSSIETFSIEPRVIQDLQEPDPGMRLKPDGSNLASVLKAMEPKSLERLYQSLGSLVPGVTKVQPSKHGKHLTLKFLQSWQQQDGKKRQNQHEAYAMSDGTLRVLGILCAFLQTNRPHVIALEEPESTIHSEALSSLLDLIRSFSKKTQIIVTTHSPELLDCKWIDPENIRVVHWERGVTYIQPLADENARSLRQHLMGAGEMMRTEGLSPALPLFDDTPKQLKLFL